ITVPGCEFSTDFGGRELHILGLFFPEAAWPEIEDYVELMHMAKRHSNRLLIDALKRDGYDVTYEEAASLTDAEDFNRAHVARVLVAKGQAESVKAAFETLLKDGAGYYTPPKRLGAITTVKFIKTYGAAAVLAHPFLNLDSDGLREFLPLAKEAGLDAMETLYTEFDEETTRKAKELAEEFGLKQSGGSDFHGDSKPAISLGTGWGDLEVPFCIYEDLALR
ncbi:MAG: phosphoesterase, partial [Clostridia bacterium]|nr:phosphoesterase [Clostridia bacterium]